MRFANFEQVLLAAAARPHRSRAAVAGAADHHVIEAALEGKRRGIIEPILIGDPTEIAQQLAALGYAADACAIHPATSAADCGRLAVELVRDHQADFLMKGFIETRDLLRPLVQKENGLNQGRTISHVAFLEIPGCAQLTAITDGGMVIAPDLAQKRDILHNVFSLYASFGCRDPRAACLCAVEHVDPKMPETVDAQALCAMHRDGRLTGGSVFGPISYDLAMSEEIARIKHFDCSDSGRFDILLVPNITCGNMVAKALILHANAKMAGLVLGARVPVVLNSRGSSAEEKLFSLALAAVGSNKEEKA